MKCKSLVSLEIFQGSLQERADLHAAAAPVHFSDLHAALYSGGEEKFNNKYNGRLIFMYRISNQTPGSKVYKNKILYSVYSKCRENICFHLFFFPRQQYRYFWRFFLFFNFFSCWDVPLVTKRFQWWMLSEGERFIKVKGEFKVYSIISFALLLRRTSENSIVIHLLLALPGRSTVVYNPPPAFSTTAFCPPGTLPGLSIGAS